MRHTMETIMQKIVNVIALLSGLTSLAFIGGSVYVYVNQDAWREEAKERLTEIITEGVTNALPGLLDSALPEIPEVPSATGPAMPF